MATYSKDDLIHMLRESELRVTDHRLAVFLYISKARQPVTVFEIIEILRKKHNIDQATVYRNLSSLYDAGLIRRLDFNNGYAHYELETGRISQMLICSKCKTIEKLEGVSVDEVIKNLFKKSKKFKNFKTQSIEIYGLCKNCA